MALLLDRREDALSEQERSDLLAIDALREVSVSELKEQGNGFLKQGKAHYGDALDCYTRAIELKIDDPLQNSVLFANRSHVNLLLGNFRRAFNDAGVAVELNPSNLKAYYRGSKAALSLNLLDQALQLCLKGLEQEPSNPDLTSLKNQAEDKLREENERKLRSKRLEELCTALERRQVKLGPHLFKELCGGKKPWLDSSNVMHWPVVFLYGEVMTSDLIEDFSEFDRFKTHLQTMFGDSYLPWDAKHEYTADRVELYYQANVVTPLSRDDIISGGFEKDFEDIENQSSSGAAKSWVKIDNNSTLKAVLAKPDCVVPGIPVFYVVAAGSQFRDLFLSGAWNLP